MDNDLIKSALDELRAAALPIEAARRNQLRVWRGQTVDRQPLLLHCSLPEEEAAAWPCVGYRSIYTDARSNMLSQLPAMLTAVRGGLEAVPSSRANMGCGIYAALFGLTQTLFDDKMPWLTEHLPKEALRDMTACDLVPSAEFRKGLEHMAFLGEAFEGTGARVYPMDLQGPVDLAHLVYGDAFFYELYDDPGFIGHLLELCAQALVIGSNLCLAAIPGAHDAVAHYNEVVLPRSRGGIKTSEDTSTLLSGEHVRDFAMPATARVLRECGGGYVHYCGHNDHLLSAVLSEEMALGLNFGNPEMHDMEDVLRRCAAVGKVFYGTIPRGGEPWPSYFTRLLKASRNGGRKYLLLSVTCAPGELQAVTDAWEKANVAADRAE